MPTPKPARTGAPTDIVHAHDALHFDPDTQRLKLTGRNLTTRQNPLRGYGERQTPTTNEATHG